jgi:signal transduction histidine kinase
MFSAARWRLTAVFTAILAVILIATGIVVYFTTSSLIYSRVDAELSDKANSQMFLLDDHHAPGGGPGGSDGDEGPAFDPGGYFYAVLDTSGNITDSSSSFETGFLVPQATIDKAVSEGGAYADVTGASGQSQRVYLTASQSDRGEQLVLEIGRSIKPEQDDLAQLRNIFMIVIAVTVLPAIAGGYLISGRVLRPIKLAVDSQRAFIADASHELRTPVAVVRTNAELLERRLASGKIGQSENDSLAVTDILAETERLGKMVSQMLTLAQADAGRSEMQRADVDLDEISLDVVRSMRAIADAKGVALSLQNGDAVWVQGDRDRLREVIVTVLDNAVKYTPSGGRIEVRVARHHRRAVVTVSDNGPGIPAESLAHIFERFYRVDKARSRDEGGTGLGLAIARHIVEAHGGEIRIESKPGAGTTVTIELRLLHHEHATDTSPLADEPRA